MLIEDFTPIIFHTENMTQVCIFLHCFNKTIQHKIKQIWTFEPTWRWMEYVCSYPRPPSSPDMTSLNFFFYRFLNMYFKVYTENTKKMYNVGCGQITQALNSNSWEYLGRVSSMRPEISLVVYHIMMNVVRRDIQAYKNIRNSNFVYFKYVSKMMLKIKACYIDIWKDYVLVNKMLPEMVLLAYS